MQQDRLGRRRISPAQWIAAREIAEGAPPTKVRIAALMGCDVSAVYARAAQEGWLRLDFRQPRARLTHRDFIRAACVSDGDGDRRFAPRSAGSGGEDGEDRGAGGDGGDGEGGVAVHGDGEAGDFDWRAAWAFMPADEADGGRDGETGGDTGGDTGGETGGRTEGESGGGPEGGGAAAAEGGAAAAEAQDPVALVARGTAFMSRRLSGLIGRAERGGRIHKGEIDELVALSRAMERWEALARERAKEKEKQSDEELAECLRIIDDRIIELAREEAERLLAAGYLPEER